MWWVSGVNVWGTVAAFEPQFVITETEGSSKRIVHTAVTLGWFGAAVGVWRSGGCQRQQIAGATVPMRESFRFPRGEIPVVVQGSEGDKSFRLAKATQTSQVATVDLLIIEMG